MIETHIFILGMFVRFIYLIRKIVPHRFFAFQSDAMGGRGD